MLTTPPPHETWPVLQSRSHTFLSEGPRTKKQTLADVAADDFRLLAATAGYLGVAIPESVQQVQRWIALDLGSSDATATAVGQLAAWVYSQGREGQLPDALRGPIDQAVSDLALLRQVEPDRPAQSWANRMAAKLVSLASPLAKGHPTEGLPSLLAWASAYSDELTAQRLIARQIAQELNDRLHQHPTNRKGNHA